VSSELSRGDSGRLRIGIDGRLLGDNRTGISRYVFELCRALDRLLPAAHFFVYGPWALQMPVSSPRWIPRVDPLEPVLRRAKRQWYTKHLWMLMREGRLCREDGLHVFWATQAPFVPALPSSVRVVATVYDLQYRIRPETLRPLARVGHRLLERRLARANAIVTISKGTAERLYHLLGYRAAAVVRPAVSREFRPRADAEVDHWLAEYGLRRPYIFSVASWDPRKNLELLIKSFGAMKQEGLLTDHTLVLCGAERGQIDARLNALLNQDAGKTVRFLGFVPDQSLPPLYTGASAFVFPSLYEGFGIPVLEARACGTPIVTTDIPELREAGGDDAIYIPPTEEGIRSGILAALARTRQSISDLSLWTWEQSAHALALTLLAA
jgi:glycosyltransferase involved in cell wall biosynthesis